MQSYYRQIIKKKWKMVTFFTVLITLATAVCGYFYFKDKYNSTAFLNIGIIQDAANQKDVSSTYYNIQAADQFSETVQGWFKNPVLKAKIEELSQNKINLTIRKQEKQNLIVTYSTNSQSEAGKISDSIKKVINQEIVDYNTQTNSKFQLTVFDSVTEKSGINIMILLALGLFAGLILGIGFSNIYDFIKS